MRQRKEQTGKFCEEIQGKTAYESCPLIAKIKSSHTSLLINLSFVAPAKASSRKATRFCPLLCGLVAQAVVSVSLTLKDMKMPSAKSASIRSLLGNRWKPLDSGGQHL